MKFLCFECFKSKKVTPINTSGSAPQQKIEGEKFQDEELIEPPPPGYEAQVRIKDDQDNEFGDPRGQVTVSRMRNEQR